MKARPGDPRCLHVRWGKRRKANTIEYILENGPLQATLFLILLAGIATRADFLVRRSWQWRRRWRRRRRRWCWRRRQQSGVVEKQKQWRYVNRRPIHREGETQHHVRANLREAGRQRRPKNDQEGALPASGHWIRNKPKKKCHGQHQCQWCCQRCHV